MQIWAESGKSALPICNYSQILYQFLTFTQNLKRSHLTPAKEAVMSLYNPIKEYKELVLTALGIGLDVMQKKASMEELKLSLIHI